MLNIDKVNINNFYSYEKEEIDFSKYNNQIVVIKGKNGAGKSTIFEAIIWGLTGKTIRKSTEPALINNVHNKNCFVEIILDGGAFVIKRGKRPAFLTFIANGKDLTQDTATATQAVIDRTLNIDYKTLMASLVWGQHNSIDFLTVSSEDKRTIIKNFLSLDTLFRYRDIIKNSKSDLSGKIKALDAVIEEQEGAIKRLQIALGDLEETDYPVGFMNLEDAQKTLDAKKKRIAYLNGQIISNKDIVKDNYKRAIELEQSIKTGPRKIPNICEECGSDVGFIEITEDTIEKYKKGLYETRQIIEKFSEKLNKYKEELEELEAEDNVEKFMRYQEYLTKKETYESELKIARDKLANSKVESQKLRLDLDIYKFWEKAFSEQGLVKYVIRNILEYFNEKCNYFLSFITNGEFEIKFDEELNETIYQNGNLVYYMSLSGGEKRKVSLCILLGLKSLLEVSGKEQSNLLLLDEIAENLDSEGLNGLFNLLMTLKLNRTIFLITHDKYLKTLLDSCERIAVVKGDNFSRIYR